MTTLLFQMGSERQHYISASSPSATNVAIQSTFPHSNPPIDTDNSSNTILLFLK